MTDAAYIGSVDDVTLQARAFDYLRARALDPDASRRIALKAIKEF
ncbi:hypothetical protein [Yinghuangia soli]|nr:hypothetical protein [Yinghuangia soli]